MTSVESKITLIPSDRGSPPPTFNTLMYFTSRGARAPLPDVAGESDFRSAFDNSSNVCAANDEAQAVPAAVLPARYVRDGEVEERRVRARSGAGPLGAGRAESSARRRRRLPATAPLGSAGSDFAPGFQSLTVNLLHGSRRGPAPAPTVPIRCDDVGSR